MLPQVITGYLQNAAQMLLCLFLLAYIIFCAVMSLMLLIRSAFRAVEAVEFFFRSKPATKRNRQTIWSQARRGARTAEN